MLLQPVYGLGVEMWLVGSSSEARQVAEATDGTRPHGDARRQRMWSRLVVRRTLQGVHGPFELGVYVQASAASRRSSQKFGLTRYQRIHLVRILKHVGIAEVSSRGQTQRACP